MPTLSRAHLRADNQNRDQSVRINRPLVAVLLVAALEATSAQAPSVVGVLQPEGSVTPRDPSAQTPSPQDAPLPPVPVTQLDLQAPDPDLDGPRISLAFGQPTPVRDILLLLVRDTRLSLVPAPGPAIEQAFIGELRNLTVREALDALLEPLGLDYTVTRQIVRVFPRALDTRLFSVDYVAAGANRPEPHGTQPRDLYAELADGVRSLLSDEGRMHLDRTAALLQVTDRLSRLERVQQYLELMLLRATRQVQLEVVFAEVALGPDATLGVDWRAVARAVSAGSATEPASPARGGPVVLTLRDVASAEVLDALSAQGRVRVLGTPRLRAMSNQPALVRSERPGGVSLSVTPQMSADGMIHMSLHPKVVGPPPREGHSRRRPEPAVREIDTLVRVRDGDMLIMSGLFEEHVTVDIDKVPVLGHLPWLGALFTRHTEARQTTDLVILLTPTLVSAESALSAGTP